MAENWTDEQCAIFLNVAMRHCRIVGEVSCEEIRQGVAHALAAAPAPEVSGQGVGDAVATIKRIAEQLAVDDCEGDAADLLDAMDALTATLSPGATAPEGGEVSDEDTDTFRKAYNDAVRGDSDPYLPSWTVKHIDAALAAVFARRAALAAASRVRTGEGETK